MAAGLVMAGGVASVNGTDIAVDEVVEQEGSLFALNIGCASDSGEVAGVNISVEGMTIELPRMEWEDEDEDYFLQLVALEAQDRINEEQLRELNQLQALRRRSRSHRSYDELLAEQAFLDAADALQKAVERCLHLRKG
ncbi:MAG: hypothetical protein KDN22_30255 [Verrucomicrobiae bacterium]|nr:hypothetical protein [Verrucomicrobiae bacterium]